MNDKAEIKRASGQRPKKRKRKQFYGNQFTDEPKVSGENLSASAKKLSTGGVLKDDDGSNFQGYLLVDKQLLFSAVEEHLCCSICHSKVKFSSENDYGLLVNLSVSCSVCGVISAFKNSMMIGKNQKASDLNRRFSFAMRCIGKGLDASKTFCGVMDLPSPVSQKSYEKIVSHIHAATHAVTKASMKQAAEEEVSLTGSSDVTVSGDGTWKTRGHTSRVGVTTVIGSETGKVIDRYVSSSYCKSCEAAKNVSKEKLPQWKSEHQKVCSKNHSGSAAQMEVNGIVEMFSRSEETYGVRYVNYIGDGDCKTFTGITNKNPYSVPVSKIECVGHVQKRMGARLRKLKT